MAILRIEARPSAGLKSYSFSIHGSAVPMRGEVGQVAIFWMRCGSREPHVVRSTLAGPAGESLGYTLYCDGAELGRFENVKSADGPEEYRDSFRL